MVASPCPAAGRARSPDRWVGQRHGCGEGAGWPPRRGARSRRSDRSGGRSPSARIPRSASGAREPTWARCSLPRTPPGRPPSRLDRRPRAGGTRGSARAPCGRAVRASMSELNRTRVRKICGPSDRTDRTYVRVAEADRDLAQLGQIGLSGLQRKLQVHPMSDRPPPVERPARAGPRPPRANFLSIWLLPLPEDAAAALSWAGGRVRSPWRSSSSTAASRSPAR